MKYNNVQNGRQLILLYKNEKLKLDETKWVRDDRMNIVDILCVALWNKNYEKEYRSQLATCVHYMAPKIEVIF